MATNILGDLLPQVKIQWVRAAVKCSPVMAGTKPHNPERGFVQYSDCKSLLRRAKARFNAGEGCGGDINALAKHS